MFYNVENKEKLMNESSGVLIFFSFFLNNLDCTFWMRIYGHPNDETQTAKRLQVEIHNHLCDLQLFYFHWSPMTNASRFGQFQCKSWNISPLAVAMVICAAPVVACATVTLYDKQVVTQTDSIHPASIIWLALDCSFCELFLFVKMLVWDELMFCQTQSSRTARTWCHLLGDEITGCVKTRS